jgi:DNA-directed RNA polymerase specialized sigma24 family protein
MMRGLRFRHNLAHLFPEPITADRAREILSDVQHGDERAMEEMILGHLRYACSVVGKYLASANSTAMADDLSEAAFFGIVDGVNAIARNGLVHDNVTGYLAKRINGEIRNYLAGRSVVVGPRGERSPHCEDISRHDFAVPPDTSIEVEEDIQYLVRDNTDECIVRMLQQGTTAADIARQLGLHKANVGRRIARIQKSYQELNE